MTDDWHHPRPSRDRREAVERILANSELMSAADPIAGQTPAQIEAQRRMAELHDAVFAHEYVPSAAGMPISRTLAKRLGVTVSEMDGDHDGPNGPDWGDDAPHNDDQR